MRKRQRAMPRCATPRNLCILWKEADAKDKDMPLYEYQCKECGRRTEKIQKFSDAELTVCPFCSGPLERTLTAPAFHFAGGGWYKDLYSSTKPEATPSEGSGKADAAPASGGSESGGTSTAATAAPSAPAAAPAASTPSAPAKS